MRKMILAILIVLGASCPAWADIDWTSGYHQINSGDVYENLGIHNDVQLDIFGGQITYLFASDTTITNWYDGEIDSLDLFWNSTVNIYGGDLSFLLAHHNGIVNLFAYDVEVVPVPRNRVTSYVTGYYYSNDEPFDFEFQYDQLSQINIVPEPATMLLLGLGGLFLRRRKR